MKMFRNTLFPLLLALGLGGCGSAPEEVKLNNRESLQLDVYRALLKYEYLDHLKDNAFVFLEKKSSTSMIGMGESIEETRLEWLKSAENKSDRAMIYDFFRQNTTEQELPEELGSFDGVEFTPEDVTNAFAENGKGWEEVYRKHPKSRGIVELSMVGFNPEGTKAIVYCGNQSDWLAGGGGTKIYKKTDGKWEEDGWIGSMWISMKDKQNKAVVDNSVRASLHATL
jgi:hypothetical protein